MCTHCSINLDRAADLILSTDNDPPSEDFLDMAESEGQGRLDVNEWEAHALERTEWDSDRSAPTPDDWERSVPYIGILPEESNTEGGSPLTF